MTLTVEEIKQKWQSQTEGGAAMRRQFGASESPFTMWHLEHIQRYSDYIESRPQAFERPYVSPPLSETGSGEILHEGVVVGYSQAYEPEPEYRPAPEGSGFKYIVPLTDETGRVIGEAYSDYPRAGSLIPAATGMEPRTEANIIHTSTGGMSIAPELEPKKRLEASMEQYVSTQQERKQILTRQEIQERASRTETLFAYGLLRAPEAAGAAYAYMFFPEHRETIKQMEYKRREGFVVQTQKEGLGMTLVKSGVGYALLTAPLPLSRTATTVLGGAGVAAGTISLVSGGQKAMTGDPTGAYEAVSGAFMFTAGAMAIKAGMTKPQPEVIEREILGRYKVEEHVMARGAKEEVFYQVKTKGDQMTIIREPVTGETLGTTYKGEFLGKEGWTYIIAETPTGLASAPEGVFPVRRYGKAYMQEVAGADVGVTAIVEVPVSTGRQAGDFKVDIYKGEGGMTPLSEHFPKITGGQEALQKKPMTITPIKQTVTVAAPEDIGTFMLSPIRMASTVQRQEQATSPIFKGREISLQHPKQFEYTISPVKSVTKQKPVSKTDRKTGLLFSPISLVTPVTSTATTTKQRQAQTTMTRSVQASALAPVTVSKLKPKETSHFSIRLNLPRQRKLLKIPKTKFIKLKPLKQPRAYQPSLGGMFFGKKPAKTMGTFGAELFRPLKRKKKMRKK